MKLLLLLASLAYAAPKAIEPLAPMKAQAPLTPIVVVAAPQVKIDQPVRIPLAQFAPIQPQQQTVVPKLGEWSTVAIANPHVAFDGARATKPVSQDPVSGGGDRDSDLPPQLQPRSSYRAAMRIAAAGALSVAVVKPVLDGEVPASTLVYALAAAWTLAAGAELLYSVYLIGKRVGRGPDRRGETRPKWKRALAATGMLALGAAAGAGIGSAPWKAQGTVVERGLGLAAPEIGARDAGTLFAEEALADYYRNPASRPTLERIRGLQTPRVFLGLHSDLPVRYEPRLHALVIAPKALAERHWTADEFLASPEKQRRLALELRADAARELFRMSQAMYNPFYDGQNLDGGPIEAEREAVLFEHDFVHDLLLLDQNAVLDAAALARYEAMLGDFRHGLARHDLLPEVSRRGYWNAGRYKSQFMHREWNWPEHAVEGYRLLAKRDGTRDGRNKYHKLAQDVADKDGLLPGSSVWFTP